MGRNKYSQHEIDIIRKLLRLKLSGTRFQQKQVRHQLRVNFEFNISDFNVQGVAFGPDELDQAVQRGAIHILDDATIEAMKLRHAEKKARDAEMRAAEEGELTPLSPEADWEKAMEEWAKWEEENSKHQENR